MQCFYTSAFSTSCFHLAVIVCIKLCVKLGKSATESLEVLGEAFGGHSLSQRWFLNDTHVSFVSKIEKEIERTIF
jgi:hypothetical protein